MKKIHTMVTAFRDGFQSYFGARVLTPDFLPAFEAAVDAGLKHLEIGGGARFQALYFYCKEDAFEMMDTLRSIAGADADLQTLSRGVNVVGLDSQSRDVIDMHARLFGKHGVSTIRNFDALNDVNNLIYSGRSILEAGLNHEVCVTMMAPPPGVTDIHTPDFYVDVLKSILKQDVPFSSICFKDASGTSTPNTVYETVRAARKLVGDDTKIVFHSHETAGVSVSQYLSAIEAGADQVDCSLAPVSGGTAQPDVITVAHALRGSRFELDVDIEKIREVERLLIECLDSYFLPPEALAVEPTIPFFPMPGGALTANTQMMRDNNIMDRYPDVIRAMGEVVAKGGGGTSVTPVSQFYFQQAFNNVMFGPWERIADGYGKMVLGYFGKTPVSPDQSVVKRAAEMLHLPPTDSSPIDINDADPEKGVEAARKKLLAEDLPVTDEAIFITATCREKGILFLKGESTLGVRKRSPEPGEQSTPAVANPAAEGPAAAKSATYVVRVGAETFSVEVGPDSAIIEGLEYEVGVKSGDAAAGDRQPVGAARVATTAGAGADVATAAAAATRAPVVAPFPAVVLRISQSVGASVSKGAELLVLESMKMETAISSPADGIVAEVLVAPGQQVSAGQTLVTIGSASA